MFGLGLETQLKLPISEVYVDLRTDSVPSMERVTVEGREDAGGFGLEAGTVPVLLRSRDLGDALYRRKDVLWILDGFDEVEARRCG